MIYKNNKTINEWYFNDAELIKVYKNGAICYYKMVLGETPSQEPCFAVVEDITQYSDTEFVDVYDKATDKWYKLNNLDQYEQYGVYGEGRTISYYEGKLTIDNGYEYEWDGSEWDNLGEITGGTAPLPVGYTEVEYVGSNGNAYINTGLQLMDTVGNTFSIEGRVWTEYYVTNDGFGYLISAESTTRPYPGFCWRWNRHNNSVLEFADNGSNATLNTVDKGDGTSGFTVSSNGTSSTNNNIPLTLFAGLTGTSSSNSAWRFSKSKYYDEFKITKNNQVVADYIPCQRDSDSKYGFYDLISESFKSSSNSNSLIGGATGGTRTEYPKYYTEKDEPENNVVFEDMAEALAYECPWVGMRATIGGDAYIFDSNYEWVEAGDIELDYLVCGDGSSNGGLQLIQNVTSDYYFEVDAQNIQQTNNPVLIGQKSSVEAVSYQLGLCYYSNMFLDYGGGRLNLDIGIETQKQRHVFGAGHISGSTNPNVIGVTMDGIVVSGTNGTTTVESLPYLMCGVIYTGHTAADVSSAGADSDQTKIFSVKIYTDYGDTLVGDYIPVIRGGDNVVTLYDKISGQYATPYGSVIAGS